jgi:hypothetical protein
MNDLTIDQRLTQLEQLHQNFRIVGGSNVTVEGSLRQGYAICDTCPKGAEAEVGGQIPPTPPAPTDICADVPDTIFLTWSSITNCVDFGASCIQANCQIENTDPNFFTETSCLSAGGRWYTGQPCTAGTHCGDHECGVCCTLQFCIPGAPDDTGDCGIPNVYMGDGAVSCTSCPDGEGIFCPSDSMISLTRSISDSSLWQDGPDFGVCTTYVRCLSEPAFSCPGQTWMIIRGDLPNLTFYADGITDPTVPVANTCSCTASPPYLCGHGSTGFCLMVGGTATISF